MQTELTQQEKMPLSSADWRSFGLVAIAVGVWIYLYNVIEPFANWLAYSMLAMPQGSHLGEALAFFFYDTPKLLLLLSGMIFVISLFQTFIDTQKVRAIVEKRGEGVGKTVASCITAAWLAGQGHKTLRLTTDPAAHLGDVLDTPVGDDVAAVSGQYP